MRKIATIVGLFLLFFLLFVIPSHAQTGQLPPSESQAVAQPEVSYQKAKILAIEKEYTKEVNGFPNDFQTLRLQILTGKNAGTIITFEHNTSINPALHDKLKPGTTVVVQSQAGPDNKPQYLITDIYRLPMIVILFLVFVVITILLTGRKGFGAIVGLCVSLAVIVGFIVPQILAHHDPLQISILGAFIILFLTTYLAHGVSKQTTIAIGATFISLVFTYFLAQAAVSLTHLAGLGTEDSYLLELTPNQSINPKGLLLGGIIISTLGALNDITVTQVALLFGLYSENKKQSFSQLYVKGFEIGKQHILSLVNTLVLVYAGSSLPVFVFLILNPLKLPYWTIINSESLSEEIIRSLAGSLGLILAVPIATLLATYFALQGIELTGKLVEHKH